MSAGPLDAYGATPATTVAGFALRVAEEIDGEWGCGHTLDDLTPEEREDHTSIEDAMRTLAATFGDGGGPLVTVHAWPLAGGCALIGVWREYCRVDEADHGVLRDQLVALTDRAGQMRARAGFLEQQTTLLQVGIGRLYDLAEAQVAAVPASGRNKLERAEARGFEAGTKAAGEALTATLAELGRAIGALRGRTLPGMTENQPETTEVSVETPAKNVDTTEVDASPETAGAAEPDAATAAMDVESKEQPLT